MELTDIKTIKYLAQRFNFSFKKGFGQNFLTDSSILDCIVSAAEIADGVLEIGPGFGVLTNALAQTKKKVIAVEVDERLKEVLEFTLEGYDNVKVIFSDILKIDLQKLLNDEFGSGEISIAANLPYYISTPIITKLLELRLPVKNMVFMLQREVAERIAAKSGRESGAISMFCQYFCEPKIIKIIPASSFYPAPKVESALLQLKMLDEPRVCVIDENMLFRVIRASFSQRRKTLANGLASGLGMDKNDISELLEEAGFSRTIRGEKLELEDFARISDSISGKIKGESKK